MGKILKLSSRKEKWLFLVTTILMILTTAVDISQPLFFSLIGQQILKIIPNVDNQIIFFEIAKLIGFMLGLVIVGVLFHLLAINFISKAATSLTKRLRFKIFNKAIALSTDKIEEFGISSLVVRTSNDLLQIRDALYMMFTLTIKAPLFVILGIGAVLIQIDALSVGLGRLNNEQYLLSIAFIVIPLVTPIVWILILIGQKNFRLQRTLTDKNNQIMLENLVGGRVIKVFNLEQNQENHFGVVNNSLRSISKKAEMSTHLLMPLIVLSMNIAIVIIQAIFGVLAIKLATGAPNFDAIEQEIGQLQVLTQTFMQFFSLILMGLILFATSMFTIGRAKPSSKRIIEVLSSQSNIQDGQSKKEVINPSIEFQNVTFKYPLEVENKGINVLENISFKVAPGEILGIIGPTGSGKTTLTNLISRFYDPSEGDILIDNENLKNYQLDNLKKAISVAFQDKLLFKGTIASNIKVGRMDASNAEVIEAAKNAEAYEFIAKKDKQFNASVEQNGTNLSGGQKQRLSIARALIKKPKILVFDDSLSALDNITETKLLNNIKNNLKGTTLVIVAQRVKSIENAHKIIVMDEGKISGIGTHKELLKNNQLYNQIYDSQRTQIGG